MAFRAAGGRVDQLAKPAPAPAPVQQSRPATPNPFAANPNQAANQARLQAEMDARSRAQQQIAQQSAPQPQQQQSWQPQPFTLPQPTPAPAPAPGPAVQALQRQAEAGPEGWQTASTPGETRPGLGDRLPIARPQVFSGNRIY
jgi:hypothetical protein